MFAVEDGATPVGYALVTNCQEFSGYLKDGDSYVSSSGDRGTPQGDYLYQIAVDPKYQGKAIGRLLVEQVIAQSGPQGVFTDVLAKPIENKKGLAFFKRQGFQEVGRLHLSQYRDFGSLESIVLQWHSAFPSVLSNK